MAKKYFFKETSVLPSEFSFKVGCFDPDKPFIDPNIHAVKAETLEITIWDGRVTNISRCIDIVERYEQCLLNEISESAYKKWEALLSGLDNNAITLLHETVQDGSQE
ncbi:MAG: hypothetical protein MJY66_08395 [Bacteroidaceae bacterium]|nr:hypothetical protein [Bacteroidaceae bacterium]